MFLLRGPLLAAAMVALLGLPLAAQPAPPPAEPPATQSHDGSEREAPSQAPEEEAQPAETEEDEDGPDFRQRSSGSVRLGGDEGFGLGSAVGDPSALYGPDRTETVLNGTTRSSTVNLTGHYLYRPVENQQLLLEVNLDPTFLGSDLSYSWQPEGWDGVWTGNFFISTAHFSPFEESVPQVALPNGESDPYLQQAGVGIEYAQQLTDHLALAVALNYQNFAFSDSLLGGTRFARDLTGTPLALGGRATGELYNLTLHGFYDTLDDRQLPTEGSRVRLGLEQGIGLGPTSTPYTRLTTNLSHLFRAPGFNDGPHSLVLNLQGGTLVGDDAPQLRGFHLGGPFSVRGYQQGEMASGTAFLQGSLEYRHHLTRFSIKDNEVELRAAAFVDYGTVLGTERRLDGMPEFLWNKPAKGAGYGVGLHFGTDFGLFRLETAWSDRGDQTTYLSVGERF